MQLELWLKKLLDRAVEYLLCFSDVQADIISVHITNTYGKFKNL